MGLLPTFLPPEFQVAALAATPILELRASIPYGIGILKMQPWTVYWWSVLGSVLPVFPILFLLEHIEPILRKNKKLNELIDKIYAKTHSKSTIIKELELIGLIIFIGIPFPGTGVWTGVLAAYILGLPKFMSVLAAFIGTAIAGFVMIFLSSLLRLG